MITTHPTTPFAGQRPGTSGLRKKVTEFAQPGYAENFIQSLFDIVRPDPGALLVIGGDGRFHNRAVIASAIRIAAANGFARALVGRGGLLSTPAASHLIRKTGAAGGLILSASHNPGGPDGDFGVKYNVANGGPAPAALTEAVYARSQAIDRWLAVDDGPEIDLDRIGSTMVGAMQVEVIDPVADYAELMEQVFDFAAIRAAIADGLTISFDAMHAVTGPYAVEIFENRLGCPAGTVRNGTPLEDFGGHHPDPNPVDAAELVARMMAADAPDFGAASDGDGDRNLIVGKGIIIAPSDSLAMLAAQAHLAPAFAGGITGIARSMPTSTAADRVAEALDVPLFETPTGWKFFGNLLDAGLINLCGDESAGTSSDHVREKDGLWAILLWLNILAVRRVSVAEVAQGHWARFGRTYYARHDYHALPTETADRLVAELVERLPTLAGTSIDGLAIERADSFTYHDPVDGSVSANQGLRILIGGGSRIVLRLSGTGTEGATLRLYLERHEPVGGQLDANRDAMLAGIAAAAERIAGITRHTGRTTPDLVS